MRALAWDDEYNPSAGDYLSRLCTELRTHHSIVAEAENRSEVFIERARHEHFDFFITDWFDGEAEAKSRNGESRGALLVSEVRRLDRRKPIFVISGLTHRINSQLLGTARPVYLRSKEVSVPFMAFDICETLRDLGLLVDRKKVFVIYGHDRKADGARQQVERWLIDRGLRPVLFDAIRSQDGVLPDIMRAMNTCAAFIALCTPDDYCEIGRERRQKWWQPRANVLFEMGMVNGLARGAHRLTILQKWVDGQADECAVLPSDWGGYVTYRFANIAAAFEDLETRLRKMGVDMNEPEPVK